MRRWIDCFLNLLFPRCCTVCDGTLSAGEKYICIKCLVNIPRTNFHLHKNNKIEQYFWGQIPIERATSFLYYTKGDDFRKILYQLKYYKCKEIGKFMGRNIALEIQGSDFFKNIDMIIPIPLHKKRERKRGYNQSEWVAKGISEVTGIPINTTSLLRTVSNPTQTKKSSFERWDNVCGIFTVSNDKDLNGKHILIIDDVLTTGATLLSGSQTISNTYDVKISILTLAVTVHD